MSGRVSPLAAKVNRALEIARLFENSTATAPREREARFPLRGSHRVEFNRDPPQAGKPAGNLITVNPVLVDAVFSKDPWIEDRGSQIGGYDLQGLAVALIESDFVAVAALQRQIGEVSGMGNRVARLCTRTGRRQEEEHHRAEKQMAPHVTPACHSWSLTPAPKTVFLALIGKLGAWGIPVPRSGEYLIPRASRSSWFWLHLCFQSRPASFSVVVSSFWKRML